MKTGILRLRYGRAAARGGARTWVRRALACVLAAGFLSLASLSAQAQAPLTFVNSETTVRRISFKFVDHQTFEESQLLEQIATQAPGFWDRVKRILPFVSPGVYPFSPVELQKDVVRLKNYYRRNGFLHTVVDYPASQLDTTSNTIHVIFTVREGPPVIIQDVGFYNPDGSYAYQHFEGSLRDRWIAFRDRTTVEVGSRYTEFDLFRIQSAVLAWLRNHGFAFAQVESEVAIDSTLNTADIRFTLTPGPLAYVEEIIVEGNESVSDKVVLRELSLKPGDRFSQRRMTQGQRELFNLNLFRLAIADLPEQPVDSSVVVRYRVRETELRYTSAQTGYAADDGATVQAEWRHRNFMGGARQLTVTGAIQSGFGAATPTGYGTGSPQRYFTQVSLRQPYLFTSGLSAIVAPYYLFEINPLQDIRFHEAGLNTTLIYEFLPLRSISLQHTFSRVRGDNQSLLRQMSLDDEISALDNYNRSVFTLSGTFGKVDNFVNRRRGFLIRPLAEAGGRFFASDVEYTKFSNELLGYLPITRRTGLNARLLAGYLWPYGKSGDQNHPLVEARFDRIRFYAGGSNDVRGWPTNLLGPVRFDTLYTSEGQIRYDDNGTPEDSTDDIPRVRYEPDGGLGKLAANLELRLPFPGLGSDWSTALFVDAGQVYPRASFTVKDLQYGVGGGIRYETIVGFVRLDLAYKVNPREWDLYSAEERWRHQVLGEPLGKASIWDRFRLHLSIGQAF